ncbi:winged helix-turn-helix transcriptional regulator [bacterium]|nr:winged helix-turn-helix transcriptional regulator [bacterium]
MSTLTPTQKLIFSAIGGDPIRLTGTPSEQIAELLVAWIWYWRYSPSWVLEALLQRSPGTVSKHLRKLERTGLVARRKMPGRLQKAKDFPEWDVWTSGATAMREQAVNRRCLPKPTRHPQPAAFPRSWRNDMLTQILSLWVAQRTPIKTIAWECQSRAYDIYDRSAWHKAPDAILETMSGSKLTIEAEFTPKDSFAKREPMMLRISDDLAAGNYDMVLIGTCEHYVHRYLNAIDDALDEREESVEVQLAKDDRERILVVAVDEWYRLHRARGREGKKGLYQIEEDLL